MSVTFAVGSKFGGRWPKAHSSRLAEIGAQPIDVLRVCTGGAASRWPE